MDNFIKSALALWGAVACMGDVSLVAGQPSEHVDVINYAGVSHQFGQELNLYCNNIIENPFSSPDYLLQQLFYVKAAAERATGSQYDLKSTIRYVAVQAQAKCGFPFPEHKLNSLLSYVDKFEQRLGQVKHYGSVDEFSEHELDIYGVNVSNHGCVALSFHEYHAGDIFDNIKSSRQIAPYEIPELNPSYTIGSVCSVVGLYLCRIPVAQVQIAGGALQGVGYSMLAMELADDWKKSQKNAKKEAKRDPCGNVDIRYPYGPPDGVVDIRQDVYWN